MKRTFLLFATFAIITTAFAQPQGDLDKTFNSGGTVITDLASYEIAYAVAAQPDGKIIVAGTSDHKVALLRYNADGSPDQAFGSKGIITKALDGMQFAHSIALQKDGKILVAGTTFSGYGLRDDNATNLYDCMIARFNADGSLDESFGTSGWVYAISDVGHDIAMALQPDGKIVVGANAGGKSSFVLARFTHKGSLDESFGSRGKAEEAVSYNNLFSSIAIQQDGKIVVGGTTGDFDNTDFAVLRFNEDGKLDNSFNYGWTATDFDNGYDGINAIAIQSDGKIVAAGYSDHKVSLVRYNTDGSLDESFGTQGKVKSDVDFVAVRSMAIQPNGKLVIAGNSGAVNEIDFTLARFNTDGTTDIGFGKEGRVVTDFGNSDGAHAVTIQDDGKIIAAGRGGIRDFNFALSRYVSDLNIGVVEFVIPDTAIEQVQIPRVDADEIFIDGVRVRGNIVSAQGTEELIVMAGAEMIEEEVEVSEENTLVVTYTFENIEAQPEIAETGPTGNYLVYPNPVQPTETLEYTLTQDEYLTIELYDISGRLVLPLVNNEFRGEGSHRESLEFGNMLAPGSYFLAIRNGSGIVQVQLTKL